PWGFESVVEGGEVPSVSVRFMERLVEKAEALGLLRHPHIVRLVGYHRHIPLLVYEYAPYGSLEWQLERGWDPSLGVALLVGLQVGDALRYIHSRGLVHGDIKPGNVFIGGERWAKVGDFSGLVRLLSKSSRSAMPRQYTLGFRAPEQVFSDLRERAKAAGLENRIDVYQLGNLILYLATGDTVDGEEYTEADEKLAEIRDPRLQGLLRLMLAKDPLERPGIEQVLPRLAEIYRTIAIK
ncbi:MAG: protein kinase, partial [Desulfurococcales archaeon]|nr:protein kinase [Desulfurococcales archaeon]